MKAIVVSDRAAGTAGMTLEERPEPPAAINDVIVQALRISTPCDDGEQASAVLAGVKQDSDAGVKQDSDAGW
jgi:hypothetical protein